MKLKNKIITSNAIILVCFVAMLTYSVFDVIDKSTSEYFSSIKKNISNDNQKMLMSFVNAQSVSLEKEIEVIFEDFCYISGNFIHGLVNSSKTKEFLHEEISHVNKNLKPFIKSISFIDTKNNVESQFVNGGVIEVDNILELTELASYRGFYIGKLVEPGLIIDSVTKLSVYVRLEHWSQYLLKFDINIDYFDDVLIFKTMLDELNYYYLLTDGKGNLMTSNLTKFDDLTTYLNECTFKKENCANYSLNNGSGNLTIDVNGELYSMTFLENSETNWCLILVTPESMINSDFFETKGLIVSATILLVKTFSVEVLMLLLLFVIINSLAVSNMLRPISLLMNQALSLKQRDFEQATRLVNSKGDEIEQLSKAYCEAGKQIQILVEDLEIEVEKRTKLYELAMKEAKDANRHKAILLSNVSHEVRTPLNAIIGYTQMLSNVNSKDVDRHHLNGISTASYMILDIVNDLLDFERIHASNYKLHPKSIMFNKLISDLKTTFFPLAQDKKLTLKVDTSKIENLAVLYVDPLRFKQALGNIISNAVKFTCEGSVTLSAYVDVFQGKSRLVFSVKDTGVGIPDTKIDSIFDGFEQVNQRDQQQGFGLGLAITRTIFSLMGGEVIVSSRVGKGSEFKVLLPRDILYFESESANACLYSQATSETSFNYQGKTALIVDDVEFNREVLLYHLNNKGFKCLLTKDGVEALKVASQHQFDVVLTDISMPNMDGLNLAHKLKEKYCDLPVIAVTARATVQEESHMSHIFDYYLTKPINIDDLSNALRFALFKEGG